MRKNTLSLAALTWILLATTLGWANPVTVAELAEIKDISSIAISPDGRYVVFRVYGGDLATNTVKMSWYVRALASGGKVVRVAGAGDPVWTENGPPESEFQEEAPKWSPDSRWFYYRSLNHGQMQVWRTSRDGGHTQRVTADAADVAGFGFLGSRLWYSVGATRAEILAAERREYDNGTVLDQSVITQFPIARTFPYHGRPTTMREANGGVSGGRYVTLLGHVPEHFEIRSTTGRARDATAEEIKLIGEQREPSSAIDSFGDKTTKTANVEDADIAPDPNSPYLEPRQGTIAWREKVPGAGTVKCAHPQCQAPKAFLSVWGWLSNSVVVFSKTDMSGQSVYAWDTGNDELRSIIKYDGMLGTDRYGQGKCPVVGGALICVASSAAVPPQLTAIQIADGSFHPLYNPNAKLTPDRLGTSERLVVRNKFGDQASAQLILPHHNARARMPLVITSYSCAGFLRGGTGDDVPEHILAAYGIVSVCLNGFPSRDRPLRDIKPGNPLGDERSIDMRRAVIDMLAERGLVDPKRVAVSGLSGGATQTLYSISHSKMFRAAIVTSEAYEDPIFYYLHGQLDRILIPDGKGQLVYDSDSWRQNVSPAGSASNIETPLLMMLPDREYLAMMQLYTEMRFYKKPVEMIIYPDEFHVKNQPRHRLSVYETSVAWLRFWLQDFEDPAMAKRTIYDRWEHLKDDPKGPVAK